MKTQQSRRQFLRNASMASLAGMAVSPFLLELNSVAAIAQQTSVPNDYKALVCIFLQGGNDGHGTVVATDTESFTAFTTARSGAPGLAYPLSSLLPIELKTPQSGRTFALNPYLGGVQNLFQAGRAAIVSNTGTLIAPTTKAQIQASTVPLPASLYSHFDQSAAWQAISATSGSAIHSGWGGTMADLIASSNTNAAFTCISTSGNALFLAGQQTFQLNVTSAGAIPITGLNPSMLGSPTANALSSILSAEETNLFAKEYGAVVQRSIAAQASLSSAMLPAGEGGVANPPQYLDPTTGRLAANDLAVSLQTVARIIGGRSSLGVSRQIFYVTLGGFDTHDNQAPQHATLLTKLGLALEYFDNAMLTAGLSDQVTTFTASDFGRTLTANSDGTDHGWGSHHIVTGGAVAGQDMYGSYPVIGVNQVNDMGAGRLIPTTSVESYAGTLAKWFGLSDGQVRQVFPNFGNFGSSAYLKFMG